jgi:hypothetical protein
VVAGVAALIAREPEPSLSASADGAGAVRLEWRGFADAASAELRREGRVLDVVPVRRGEYTDRLLWERTRYRYELDFRDDSGARVGRLTAAATTEASDGADRLYDDDAWVNSPPGDAVHPDSARMVGLALVAHRGNANFSVSDEWGIPIAYADPSSPSSEVRCERYGCSLEVDAHRTPAYAAPNTGSDHHLVVLDPDAGSELDLWGARREGEGWAAGSRWTVPWDGDATNCEPGDPCSGANAANLPLAAGVVRPEEIAAGRIEHALALTTPSTRAGPPACPAVASDGAVDDPGAIPIGARLRLDPAVDVAALGLPGWQRTIARALQTHGAVVVDTSGSLAIRGESTALRGYDAWARVRVPRDDPSLSALPWDRMQVLEFEECPDSG